MSIYFKKTDPDAHPVALQDLPGNILTAHARDCVAVVLFRFTKNSAAARALARRMGALVTSAYDQRRIYLEWRDHRIPEPPFYGFALSHSGYAEVGVTTTEAGLPPAESPDHFSIGMRAEESVLSPRDGAATWEPAYAGAFDGAVIVADWTAAGRDQALSVLVNFPEWTQAVASQHVEYGRSFVNEFGQRVEHFGYADGVRQPLFFTGDIDEALSHALGGQLALPAIPAASIAVARVTYPVASPAGPASHSGFGSFLVFRKLEQNVAGFAAYCEQLAVALDAANPNPELAGAYLVGRFRDGTPLDLSDRALGRSQPGNDFGDRGGESATRCPSQAHVHQASDRTDATNKVQLVRRGITYGERPLLPCGALDDSQQPNAGIGLLFMAHMRFISQFFAMQQGWLNADFPASSSGVSDTISGHSSPSKSELAVITPWNAANRAAIQKHTFAFARFVTVKGGGYFFAPPIGFLKSLT